MSVTPTAAGQIYKDTNTGNLWRANSTTAGDWTLELQNMNVKWSSTSVDASEKIGFFNYNNVAGITSLTFEQSETTEGFDIELMDDLVSLSFPNLVTVPSGGMNLPNHSDLTSVSAPLLTGLSFTLSACPSIVSISLPSFIGDTINIHTNASLQTISVAAFLPTNGQTINCSTNALTAASVNHILARCVANAGYVTGTITLSGGTNAAPTGQGIADKATLIGRGVTVNTN